MSETSVPLRLSESAFHAGMDKLKSVFGAKAYPPERLSLFFKKMRHLPNHIFEEIVRSAIENMRVPPLMSEFYEVMAKIGYKPPRKKPVGDVHACSAGHLIPLAKYEKDPVCEQCMLDGNMVEVARNPYRVDFIPVELREWSLQFKRKGNETLPQYARRTVPLFKELNRTAGITKGKPGNLSETVRTVFKELE